jgi:uncharacterized protein YbjQ (UPF0145 family)
MGLFGPDKCEGCGVQDKNVALHAVGRKLCPRCSQTANAQIDQYKARVARVIVTTGDLKRDYEIVEVVMSLQAGQDWTRAWAGVLEALRGDAVKLGCDAVISLQVEHRVFVEQKQAWFETKHIQGVEFFACGTAVRFR